MKNKKRFAISFVGNSGSGKTTLIVKLIGKLRSMGIAVSVIKHTEKVIEVDKKGKDSWLFSDAGASGVVLYTGERLFYNLAISEKKETGEIIEMLEDPVDIVLVEGFKNSDLPAIALISEAYQVTNIMKIENIVAVASDLDISAHQPRFMRDDIDGITRFILDMYKKF